VTVAVGTAPATLFSIGLNGIPSVSLKGAGGSDTLTGPDQANAWVITAPNTGTLNGSTSFSAIRSLTGGSGADTFTFASNTASLSGNLDGGGGANVLDFSGRTSAVTATLSVTGLNKATAIAGAWTNVGTLIGSAALTNALIGPNANTTWVVNGPNTGTVGGLTFSGFENLTGGSLNDTFQFTGSGNLSGNLNGGLGTNLLDVSGSAAGAVTVNLQTRKATPIGGTWSNLMDFQGNDTANGLYSTLIGPNMANTWAITATDTGTVANKTFAGFANLTGGSGTDTFSLADGKGVLGRIDGGAGINTLDDSAYSSGMTINLALGTATNVLGGIANIQNANGGSGNDVLVGNALANTLNGNGGNDLVIGGGGADKLNGGAGDDILIAGTTLYDQTPAALDALMAYWGQNLPFPDLVAGLRAGIPYTDNTGAHTAALTASTVFDDAAKDTLTGGGDTDWFFARLAVAVKDVITDLNQTDVVTPI
jgi:Ca2+-binding RTX toxin-like protein